MLRMWDGILCVREGGRLRVTAEAMISIHNTSRQLQVPIIHGTLQRRISKTFGKERGQRTCNACGMLPAVCLPLSGSDNLRALRVESNVSQLGYLASAAQS